MRFFLKLQSPTMKGSFSSSRYWNSLLQSLALFQPCSSFSLLSFGIYSITYSSIFCKCSWDCGQQCRFLLPQNTSEIQSNLSIIFRFLGCFSALSMRALALRFLRQVLSTPMRSNRCISNSKPYFSASRSWQQQSSRLFLGRPTDLAASSRLIFLMLFLLRWSSLHFLTISMTQKITLSLLLSFLISDSSLSFSGSLEASPDLLLLLVILCIMLPSLTRTRSQLLPEIQLSGIGVSVCTGQQALRWKSQTRTTLSEISRLMCLNASQRGRMLSVSCSCSLWTETFSLSQSYTTMVLTTSKPPCYQCMIPDWKLSKQYVISPHRKKNPQNIRSTLPPLPARHHPHMLKLPVDTENRIILAEKLVYGYYNIHKNQRFRYIAWLSTIRLVH